MKKEYSVFDRVFIFVGGLVMIPFNLIFTPKIFLRVTEDWWHVVRTGNNLPFERYAEWAKKDYEKENK